MQMPLGEIGGQVTAIDRNADCHAKIQVSFFLKYFLAEFILWRCTLSTVKSLPRHFNRSMGSFQTDSFWWGIIRCDSISAAA